MKNIKKIATIALCALMTVSGISLTACGAPKAGAKEITVGILNKSSERENLKVLRNAFEKKLRELMQQDFLEYEKKCEENFSMSQEMAVYYVQPSIFNQALMELGATVCVPNGAPHCEVCPWHDLCEARIQERIAELPVKKKAKARRIEEKTVFIIKDGEQLALHKRANKGLLAGLYELPNTEGHLNEQEAIAYIKERGYTPIRIQPACDAKHIFSHVEWHMKGYVVFLQAHEFVEGCDQDGNGIQGNSRTDGVSDWIFVDVEETKENYAIPSAFVKYTEYLNLTIGKEAIEKK